MTTEWKAPARIDDLLEVSTRFVGAKGAWMQLDQEIWREETLVARAAVEAACMNMEGRARRLPEEIKAAFAADQR